MNNTFIVSDWFADRAKLDIQLFNIEDVEFEIMALTDELDMFWALDAIPDSEPCIQYRVGEKVCGISGLTEIVEKMIITIIDGDNLPSNEITLGQLEDDAIATGA